MQRRRGFVIDMNDECTHDEDDGWSGSEALDLHVTQHLRHVSFPRTSVKESNGTKSFEYFERKFYLNIYFSTLS